MTIWITGDISLTQPLIVNEPTENVVVLGKLNSENDISFRVNNLVVLGKIITTKNVSIVADGDFFNAGKIKADLFNAVVKGSSYNTLDHEAIEKIRMLGIDIEETPTGYLQVNSIPSGCQYSAWFKTG